VIFGEKLAAKLARYHTEKALKKARVEKRRKARLIKNTVKANRRHLRRRKRRDSEELREVLAVARKLLKGQPGEVANAQSQV
jgi:hypothetical protein